MGKAATFYEFTVGGLKLSITYSIVIEWIVMAVIIIAAYLATRNFKTIPGRVQFWAEVLVDKIDGLVKGMMGNGFTSFVPYIGTLAVFLGIINLFGLIGLTPPTADYSVALGFTLLTFAVIHGTAIKRLGFFHYLVSYTKPFAALTPLTIIERLVVLISLSMRLFGNIAAGMIMVDMLYQGLNYLSKVLHLSAVPVFKAVIPIPFHVYFDLFDGLVQMFIFIMLTMIYTKTIAEH